VRGKNAAADEAAKCEAVKQPTKRIDTPKCFERRLMAVPSGPQKTAEPTSPTVGDRPPSLRETEQAPARPLA
jgi:hypothetical protein